MCKVFVIIATAALVLPAFNAAASGGGGQTGTVKGYVKNSMNSMPISGAQVLIVQISKSANTDSTGYYVLSSVAAGTYTLQASKTGFVMQTKLGVTVTKGTTTWQNFSLVPQGYVTGYVLDRGSYQPLVQAHITLVGTSFAADSMSPDGHFNITNVDPGNYTLKVSKSGYIDYTYPYLVPVVTNQATYVGNLSIAKLTGQLPQPIELASAAWNGTLALIFGGTSTGSDYLNQIIKYDPASDTNVTLANKFTSGRQSTSAVWTGQYAYVFGGKNSAGALREVVRYDPMTDSVTTYTTCLPTAVWGTSVAWTGTYAYIFGGAWGSQSNKMTSSILRFDPSTNTTTTMTARLPSNRAYTSAAYDGRYVYVFGGVSGSTYLDQIVRYDPIADQIVTLTPKLPQASAYSAAMWDGQNVCIYGGKTASAILDTVVMFNATYQNVSVKLRRLPLSLDSLCGINDGYTNFLFGGETSGAILNDVLRYQEYMYGGNTGSDPYYLFVGGMVNTANGNLVVSVEDISFQAKGFKVSLVRTYNSLAYNSSDSAQGGPFGFGWTDNWRVRASVLKYGDVQLLEGCGSQHLFIRSPGGYYITPPGLSERLTRDPASGLFTLWSLGGSYMCFDAKGRLANVTNKNGNHLFLDYDDESCPTYYGRLTDVRDESGLYLNFTYAGSTDQVVAVSGPGETVTYSYDGVNGLYQVSNTHTHTETCYSYYANSKWQWNAGQLRFIRNGVEIRRVQDPYDPNYTVGVTLFDTTNFTYDQTGRAIAVWQSATFLDGGVWFNLYQPVRKFLIQYQNPTSVTATCALGHTLQVTMDREGLPTRMSGSPLAGQVSACGSSGGCGGSSMFPGKQGNENLTLNWTQNLQIANSTDGDNHKTAYQYDSYGNLVKTVDALGYNTTSQVKVVDEPRQYISLVQSETDALGHKTQYFYDSKGRNIKIVDALGNYTESWYDSSGNLIKTRDKNGNIVQYGYDSHGLMANSTNPLNGTTEYSTDVLAQIYEAYNVTSPMGFVTSDYLTYNTTMTWQFQVDQSGNSTITHRNYRGDLMSVRDYSGNVSLYVTNITLAKYDTTTDGLGHITRYYYNAMGFLVSIVDAKNHSTNMTYDNFGRLVSVTLPMGQQYVYAYDRAGNLASRRDPNGNITTYSYDALNRLNKTLYPNHESVNYTYNAMNLVKVVDLKFERVMGYDALNRPVWISTQDFFPDSIGSRGDNETLGYDANGNRNIISDSDVVGQYYISYTYDANNRLTLMNTQESSYRFYYDLDGRLTKMDYVPFGPPSPSYSTTYTYDSRGNLLNMSTSSSDGGWAPASYSYKYDAMNRVAQSTEPGATTTYAYDAIGQFTGFCSNSTWTNFTFDAVGNRLTESSGGSTITSSYDADDRLVSSSDGMSCRYDKNGNLVYESSAGAGSGPRYMSYDYENHLSFVNDSNGRVIVGYNYSYDGNKIMRYDPNSTIRTELYWYSIVSRAVGCVDFYPASGGSLISHLVFFYGPGTDWLVGWRNVTSSYQMGFAFRDGLGNTRTLVTNWWDNSTGGQRWTSNQSYSPLGSMSRPPVSPLDLWAWVPSFQGRPFDYLTGLYDYRARAYDPNLARYTTRAAEPKYGESAYMFPNNDPVTLRDPTGNPTGKYLWEAIDWLGYVHEDRPIWLPVWWASYYRQYGAAPPEVMAWFTTGYIPDWKCILAKAAYAADSTIALAETVTVCASCVTMIYATAVLYLATVIVSAFSWIPGMAVVTGVMFAIAQASLDLMIGTCVSCLISIAGDVAIHELAPQCSPGL